MRQGSPQDGWSPTAKRAKDPSILVIPMTKKLLPLLLAFVFAFAGCLGTFSDDPDLEDQDPDPVDDGDEDDQDADGGNDDADTADDTNETTNEAPTSSLAANVTGGFAPLGVEFTLAGADADEDELTWTLDLGSQDDPIEGDGFPSTVEHTFDEVGDYTVTLTVSDGTDSTTDELVITVTDDPEPIQAHTGGWMLTIPVYCGIDDPIDAELNGIFTQGVDVDPASIGETFTTNLTTEVDAGILEYQVAFTHAADGEFTVIESFSEAPGTDITGTVPESAEQVYFSACGVSAEVAVEYWAG